MVSKSSRLHGRSNTIGISSHVGSVAAANLQEALQEEIDDALGQVAEASRLLQKHSDGDTQRLESLLEEIVRKQDDIGHRHDAWVDAAEATGDVSHARTGQLGVGFSRGFTREAAHRYAGKDREHDKELFYERAIQTLEQQLYAFKASVQPHAAPNSDGLTDVSEDGLAELEDMESSSKNKDNDAVGRYMHRAEPPTTQELYAEAETYSPFPRRRYLDALGCFLFAAFIVCTCGYAYVRIVYSIEPLEDLAWYGALVFAIEMIGAISIMFYGVWLIAKPDNSDVEAAATVKLRRAYHIRVLVPCYSEPLPIVQRTVLAARRALVPEGCKVTIYLCDDGKRSEKRHFCEQVSKTPGPPVIYVTGRPRLAGKTLNGKSENLNHCLKLIYPADRDLDERPNISITELMCLFDADQSCSRMFFQNLMPYIDSGDDVAVALSPQLMFNVSPDRDIFNHQNVHFWEKMQPGMDALGFISLTGTNMIMRCRALQDCEWFPVNSVTEDWELGMRMKKWGWKCRYVQSYNAIGEAPEEVRQCFQQRSRWSKGHFQTFWSAQCPLFDRRLGPFYALCYSSTCLSYISSAVSIPVMTLVPIVTLLFGYFPIALNFETVLAITIYYISLHALTFYCKSMRELRALWLANIGNAILFWPYLKASMLTPLKQIAGKGLTFKSTSKGASKNAVSIKEIGPSLVIVLASLLAFIAGLTNFDVSVNAPKAIALCWVLYNCVPHVLLLIYSRFGSGGILQVSCNVLAVTQTILSLLALILLWLLYPRDEDYTKAASLSLNFLFAQRSGVIVQPYPVQWRFTSGMQNTMDLSFYGVDALGLLTGPQNTTVDLTGGFYTDGEIGPVKVTTHVAMTTAMVAWSLLDFAPWWDAHPREKEEALEVVTHGLEYVAACYAPNPLSPLNSDSDVLVIQVGDIFKERMLWRRPEDVREQVPVLTLVAGDSPADVAGQMTAGMVAGTLALYNNARVAREEATTYIDKAHRLFRSAMFAPQTYMTSLNGSVPLTQHYPSNSYFDDLFWASTWMLRSTQDAYGGFRKGNNTYYYFASKTTFDLAFAERDSMAVSMDYVNNVALVHAAVITQDWSFHSAAQSWIWDWMCSGDVRYTTFGRAWHAESNMLGDTAMAAAIAATYVRAARQWDKASGNSEFMTGFHCFAEAQGRLFLGVNYRKPLLTSFNSRSYSRLFHRGASCPTYPSPCDVTSAYSDLPDQNDLRGALLWLPGFRDSTGDQREAGENGTVVSLENNVAVPLLFSALAYHADNVGGYMKCLQGQGSLLPHPVCKHDRPLSTRLGPEDVPIAERPERFKGLWTERDSVEYPPPPPPTPSDLLSADLGAPSPIGAGVDTLGGVAPGDPNAANAAAAAAEAVGVPSPSLETGGAGIADPANLPAQGDITQSAIPARR